MHFSLIKMSSSYAGFDDVILPLYYSLQRLGYAVEILRGTLNTKSCNIIFGSCTVADTISQQLPPNSIIFNLEQLVSPTTPWATDAYIEHLKNFTVLDFSQKNVELLQQKGVKDIYHLPLGYVQEMTRLKTEYPKKSDTLFYGTINTRRAVILEKIIKQGTINIALPENVYGSRRDQLLAETKTLLHIHYYTPASLEIARLGYAFANKIPVVAEWRADTEMPEHLREACAYYPYENLVEGLTEIVQDEAKARLQANKGFAAFASHPFEKTVWELFGVPSHAVSCSKKNHGENAYLPFYRQAQPEWIINTPVTTGS